MTDQNTPTIEEQVNSVVSSLVQDSDGKWQVPADVAEKTDPSILYAAKTERRFRDTQAGYTRANQKVKELDTVNAQLTAHMVDNATMHLTPEERDELDDLKTSDVDAWRAKITEHEGKAKELSQSKIGEFEAKGKEVSLGEQNKLKYEAFTERTGLELSDHVINNELPASLASKFKNDEIEMDDFLTQAEKFLTKSKVVQDAGAKPDTSTQMDKLTGGQEPSHNAQARDSAETYANEVY